MKSPIILLVEDNEDDMYLTRRALSKAGLKSVFDVTDGQEAVDYIQGGRKYSDRTVWPFPDIILLDLKIPEISGHEVAEWIKSRPEYDSCLVYILSSSGETRDRDRAIASSQGYFVKPLTAAHIETICQHFQDTES
ncbi:MAG: response regulator [Candidatus Methylacidiphilales bacterium]|nr:response regulator [Candidatus Methylacidiphilales bacterium]